MKPRRLAPILALALAGCGQATETPAPEMPGNQIATAPAAWRQCVMCHSTAPRKNGIGPSLAGIHGQPAAHEPSYAYSSAMRASGIVWDDAALDAYLTNPRAVVPGTKMAFGGIADPAERAKLIAFLETL